MGVLTRRNVLVGAAAVSGGLLVGVKFTPDKRLARAREMLEGDGENLITTWVKISRDNIVTVVVPHAEMGQGVHTALPMMLAEELEADWDLVTMVQAPAETVYANNALVKGYLLDGKELPAFLNQPANWSAYQLGKYMDMQVTGGSTSVRTTGQFAMRVAGAAVKDLLVEAAARQWGVPGRECSARLSQVFHNESGRSAPYGKLAASAAGMTASASPKLKSADDFTIIGTSKPRFDIPGKVNGTATYGMDIHRPGMKIASIQASPVFGGKVTMVNSESVTGLRGIETVVNIGDAVAVVGDNFWRVNSALANLDVQFDGGGNEGVSSDTIYSVQANAIETSKRKSNISAGDLEEARTAAVKTINSEYRAPYLAHAQMEPLNCTAEVSNGKCEIWVGVQDGLAARAMAAKALGIAKDDVAVHLLPLGGGFGRRGGSTMDFIDRSVRVAAQLDGPVKVIWSREEDMRQGTYRPASVSRFEAGLDSSGKPVFWTNVHVMDEEAEAVHIPYGVETQLIESVEAETHVPYGPWRSVASSQHGFFIESFIDELAHEAGMDPYHYRSELLGSDPRSAHVLKAAAHMSGWGGAIAEGRARGIALKKSFGSIVAEVAEVSIVDGAVRVHKVWCAADPGDVVNPDTFAAQMEGGIIFGLTAALYGEITIEQGRAVEGNFPDYKMITMADTPEIEVEIIRSGEPWGGAGEPGTPPIAPAVTNAVFALTGTRVRQLPLKNHAF